MLGNAGLGQSGLGIPGDEQYLGLGAQGLEPLDSWGPLMPGMTMSLMIKSIGPLCLEAQAMAFSPSPASITW